MSKRLFREDHLEPLCRRDTHTNGNTHRHNFGAMALPRSCLCRSWSAWNTLLVTGTWLNFSWKCCGFFLFVTSSKSQAYNSLGFNCHCCNCWPSGFGQVLIYSEQKSIWAKWPSNVLGIIPDGARIPGKFKLPTEIYVYILCFIYIWISISHDYG